MVELKFRNFVTLLVIGGLIGGAGIAIVSESFTSPSIVVSEITMPDGTFTRTYANNSLSENPLFNIWIGTILGFGGAIIAVLYKASKGSGED